MRKVTTQAWAILSDAIVMLYYANPPLYTLNKPFEVILFYCSLLLSGTWIATVRMVQK